MEVFAFLGLLLAVGVYLAGRYIERRQRERRELRWFYWDASFADALSSWTFDFVVMTALDRFAQPLGRDYARPHQLHRDGWGVWRTRPTFESWQQEVADVNESRSNFVPEETIRQRLEWLGTEPTWRELPPSIAAPLESQYQRFLLHYRE